MTAITLLCAVYAMVFVHMTLYWCWYLKTRNPGVIDVGWASALALAGSAILLLRFGRMLPLLPLGLLLLWGLRLGGYLWYTRIRPALIEKRYLSLSQHWTRPKALGFFLHYQLQGLLALLVASPWFFMGVNRPLWLNVLAVCLIVIGLVGETLADWQLYRFKNTPQAAMVCNVGLWQLSRHPNYFFEWMIWCGFSVFALNEPFGAFALLSPIALYLIMTRITAPITEQNSIASRGEAYLRYQRQTPMFFPKITK